MLFHPLFARAGRKEKLLNHPYLFPHDISGLHDAARRQSVVTGQQDGLLQRHTEGAAVAKEEKNEGQSLAVHWCHLSRGCC